MQKIVSGIVVCVRMCAENTALVGVLLESSEYIKGYCDVSKHQCAIGQQIVLKIYGIEKTKMFIDSIEHSLVQVFWGDLIALQALKEILLLLDTVPQNIKIDGLYDKFLSAIKAIHSQQNTAEFKLYLKSLIHD